MFADGFATVIDYEYSEIADILGKTEANCRQLMRRAGQSIRGFESSPAQHRELLEEFLRATSSGQVSDFVALLSSDVVLYSDAGGRASATLNPIYGSRSCSPVLARHNSKGSTGRRAHAA